MGGSRVGTAFASDNEEIGHIVDHIQGVNVPYEVIQDRGESEVERNERKEKRRGVGCNTRAIARREK